MSNTKIVSRVRKLLALSRSANPHEAAVAAAHAQRLVEAHRLDSAILAAEPGDDDRWAVRLHDDALDAGARLATWKVDLAMVVAEANACRVVLFREGAVTTIKVVGAAEDAKVVRAVYRWLRTEVDRLVRGTAIRGRVARDSFRHGVILAVEESLAKAKRAERRSARGRPDQRRLVAVQRAVAAVRQREVEAERLVDELCETEMDDHSDDVDTDGLVTGMVMGRLVDVGGHRGRVGGK